MAVSPVRFQPRLSTCGVRVGLSLARCDGNIVNSAMTRDQRLVLLWGIPLCLVIPVVLFSYAGTGLASEYCSSINLAIWIIVSRRHWEAAMDTFLHPFRTWPRRVFWFMGAPLMLWKFWLR